MAATGALYLVAQGEWFCALALFALGTIGFNGGVVFNDALLLDIAKPGELDRVSAFGYSLGYLGGGLLFLVNVLMVQNPGWFGLADASEAVRVSFLTVAVWWLLFTIPVMRRVHEHAAWTAPAVRRRQSASDSASWAAPSRTCASIACS